MVPLCLDYCSGGWVGLVGGGPPFTHPEGGCWCHFLGFVLALIPDGVGGHVRPATSPPNDKIWKVLTLEHLYI